jgi:hypothetical protein
MVKCDILKSTNAYIFGRREYVLIKIHICNILSLTSLIDDVKTTCLDYK